MKRYLVLMSLSFAFSIGCAIRMNLMWALRSYRFPVSAKRRYVAVPKDGA